MNKSNIMITLFGSEGLETERLDSYLKIYTGQDGVPRPGVKNIVVSPELKHIDARVVDRLLEDGMLKPYLDGYVITSKGMEFIADGGYRKQLLYKKASRLSIWLSIVAVLISVASFLRSC